MRILLDECVPARLVQELVGHDVRTVPQMGWASYENGALLALAEGKFDVFLTTDQRISYQQAVAKFTIALVVLVARRNKIEFLVRLLPELLRALPAEARAALASSLLESLDEQIDEDVEAAWKAEIARRLDALNKGKAKLIPWATVRRRLLKRLRS